MNNSLDQIRKKAKDTNVEINKNCYIFRISRLQVLKIVLLASILIFEIFYLIDYIKSKDKFVLTIIIGIGFYVVYSIYQMFKYKIIIDNKSIITEKYTIDLTKVVSLKLIRHKNNNYLELITDDKKRYMLKLDITKKHIFLALISKLTNKEIM